MAPTQKTAATKPLRPSRVRKPHLSTNGKVLGGPPGPKQQALVQVMEAKGWLTPESAARKSGTALGTVYNWIGKGAVRTERVGMRRVFVHEGDLKKMCGPAFGVSVAQ